jgi:hypothetical protein
MIALVILTLGDKFWVMVAFGTTEIPVYANL